MDTVFISKQLELYRDELIKICIKDKMMSPLQIGQEVYLVSKHPDKLFPRVKKVEIANIIQDSSKTFNFEAKIKQLFSNEEVFVYFKDEDIGEKVFLTKEELIEAGFDD